MDRVHLVMCHPMGMWTVVCSTCERALLSQPDLGSNPGSDTRCVIMGNSLSLNFLICKAEMVMLTSQCMEG